jgi:hypothetical protein
MGRYVDVHLGTAAEGPLLGASGGAPAATVRFVNSAAGNNFGLVNLGGGVKGTAQAVSFIGGDNVPDLVLAGQAEVGAPLYIVNGAAIPSMSGTIDVSTSVSSITSSIVKVSGALPTGWTGYSGSSLIIRSNNDNYADFVIGESAFGVPGRVVVFY